MEPLHKPKAKMLFFQQQYTGSQRPLEYLVENQRQPNF